MKKASLLASIIFTIASPASSLVEVSGLSEEQQARPARELASEPRTCGCGMTVAECLVEDPDCDMSKEIAARVINRVTEESGAGYWTDKSDVCP